MRSSSDQLRGETKQLVNALRAPQVRGRWGELQLERIVQLAGMVEHCDFSTQVTGQGEDGGVRPDMVVRLAGGKQIVVDAKVPFAAYLEAVESQRPRRARASGSPRMPVSCASTSTRCRAKSYWAAFQPSPEFVVLFVPGDPFLEAALQADPALLEHAFSHNVVVATPTTLIALLRTVAYSWRQEALARNAAQVHQLGKELHSRLATMGTHVAKLGRSLDAAVEQLQPDGVLAGGAGAGHRAQAHRPGGRRRRAARRRPRSSGRRAPSPRPSWSPPPPTRWSRCTSWTAGATPTRTRRRPDPAGYRERDERARDARRAAASAAPWPMADRSVLPTVLGVPPVAAVGIAAGLTALGVLRRPAPHRHPRRRSSPSATSPAACSRWRGCAATACSGRWCSRRCWWRWRCRPWCCWPARRGPAPASPSGCSWSARRWSTRSRPWPSTTGVVLLVGLVRHVHPRCGGSTPAAARERGQPPARGPLRTQLAGQRERQRLLGGRDLLDRRQPRSASCVEHAAHQHLRHRRPAGHPDRAHPVEPRSSISRA